MPTVKQDQIGLYIAAGGYCARPLPNKPTRFKPGDKVKTHHFSGSTKAGVGKDSSCKRGEYLEYWITTGYSVFEIEKGVDYSGKTLALEDIKGQTNWYFTHPFAKNW